MRGHRAADTGSARKSPDFLLTSLIVVPPGTGVLFTLAAGLERIPLPSRDAPAVPRR
jgi:hypothetical protein